MKMEIEIIHRDFIKPSIPTPDHLRTYKISLLDQLLPVEHVPVLYFYPFDPNSKLHATEEKINRLKESLSKTLTHFCQFAGKIKDDLSIDCNDEGVPFVEARVKNLELTKFLKKPDCQLMHLLSPPHDQFSAPHSGEAGGTCVFTCQVNIFQDGGIAVSISGAHRATDGTTFGLFLRAWSAMASGAAQVPYPNFIGPSLYPQDPSLPKDSTILYWPNVLKKGKCITKRFIFNASAVVKLRQEASSSSGHLLRSPTRVDVVSAILWRCIMRAAETRHGSRRPSLLCQAASIRKRVSPPLPDLSAGNLIWNLTTPCKANASTELRSLISYMRESRRKLDNHVAVELQGKQGYTKVPKLLQELKEMFSDENADYIPIASWFHFGMYETDFGWGKPIWVSPGGTDPHEEVFTNMIYLMETSEGSGIETWVSLEEQEMAILERDPLLLSFASLEASPCEGKLLGITEKKQDILPKERTLHLSKY